MLVADAVKAYKRGKRTRCCIFLSNRAMLSQTVQMPDTAFHSTASYRCSLFIAFLSIIHCNLAQVKNLKTHKKNPTYSPFDTVFFFFPFIDRNCKRKVFIFVC